MMLERSKHGAQSRIRVSLPLALLPTNLIEKSLRAKSPRQKFEDIKVLMREKPKAEKSLRAKSPRQKFEDIKVLMSEKPKVEKSLRANSPRRKFRRHKNLHERRA